MLAKVAVVGLGAVLAVLLAVLPDDYRLPAGFGIAAVAFGLYALRERAAIRGLFGRLTEVAAEHRRQAKADSALQAMMATDAAAAAEHQRKLAALERELDRLRSLLGELVSVHAVAYNELMDAIAGVETADARGHATTQAEALRLHHARLNAAGKDFRQVEALIGLNALLSPRALFPPSRKWAASPDFILALCSRVLSDRPELVVELGGGLSTIWLGYAVERAGKGRVVSIDHDAEYAERTRALVRQHGLEDVVEVRHAPLIDVTVGNDSWPWYDTTVLDDLDGCDLLVVDGPPGALRSHARYPAMPLLVNRLAETAVVMVDDCVRTDEQEIVARWVEEYPGWRVETLEHEKRTSVLSR